MNKSIFIGTSIFSVVVIFFASIILFREDVNSFNLFGFSDDCTPYNVFVEKGSKNYTVKVSWRTRGKCSGFVQYGLDGDKLDSLSLDHEGGDSGRIHESELNGIVSTQKYYYLINSNGQSYGSSGMPLNFIPSNLEN